MTDVHEVERRTRSLRRTSSSRPIEHKYSVQVMCRVLGVAPSGYYAWLEAAAVEARAGGCPAASPDPRVVHGEPGHLRRPTRLPGSARGRRDVQQASRRPADARAQLARPAWLSHAALVGRQAGGPDPESPAAPVHGDAAKQGVGHGYHLHSDVAGLALPGRRHGSVLAQDRRLVRRVRRFTASSCSTPC